MAEYLYKRSMEFEKRLLRMRMKWIKHRLAPN